MADPVVQNVTTNTSNLPSYAQPYFTDLLNRGSALSNQPYTAYPGQRIAGFTPGQTQAQQDVFGLTAPNQFGTASDMAQTAGLGALNASAYSPTTFSAQQITAPQLQQYSMDMPQTFDSAAAQKYMSPYIQNVLDLQKQEAIRDAQKDQLMTNLNAARLGTYGGSRQLLAGLERERSLGTNLANIEATGLQAAYNNAQQQFNADQNRGLTAAQANLASYLQTQGLSAQQALAAATSNQTADLQAQQMAEQSKQFGSSLGLQGLAQALQSAQTLGNLGTAQQNADLQRIQAQSAAGAEQQNQNQKYLDTAYADFLRQRDYPMEQLSYYNDLLRGLPMSLNSTQTTYGQAPSTTSQIAGLGLGALSLAKLAS